jgi:hypothetical protein
MEETMTNRERMLAVLNREAPDRVPWIPRLLLWYNARKMAGTLPDRWKHATLREVERDLRLGTPARTGKVFEIRYEGVEIETRKQNGKSVTEYRTPAGSVSRVEHYTDELDKLGLPGRVEEYPLKQAADYKVWRYIIEHMHWDPVYDAYEAYDREIGDDGLPMIAAGDVPLHDFLLNLAGYEQGFFHLADFADEAAALLDLMTEVQRERLWPVLLESPARLYLHGVHLSSQFTPPPLFERHVLPYYKELAPLLHEAGKSFAMHADNDTSLIAEMIEQAGWDMVECFVTAPMVPMTLDRARRLWEERVIIWGGIPSNMLSASVSDDEFRSYCHWLFDAIAPGKAFILGVADNVMPDSSIDRVAWISDLVEERGAVPVSKRGT